MSEPTVNESHRTGKALLLFALSIFIISVPLCYLIQEGFLPHNHTTETIGFIVYFCLPLPIIPGMIAVVGFILLAQPRK